MSDNVEKYDVEKAQELAKDYTNATGIECLLIDDDEIFNPCPGAVHKEFCFQKDEDLVKYCLNVHRNGAAAAKNAGKSASYFCPMGLLHWSAPIVIDGKMEAAFIAGHVFPDEAKENILKQRQLSELHEKVFRENPELRESMLSSVVLDDNRLASLKNILDMMAISVSESCGSEEQVDEIHRLL
ncbi:MAG: PocR ligand-binding domain-containing protein, partial [Bacillota bacterium]|nr:PocR ligand-binding domain-containing protein [Bacillota bacterium]